MAFDLLRVGVFFWGVSLYSFFFAALLFLREVDLEATREDFLGAEAVSFLLLDLDLDDYLSKTLRVDFFRAARCVSRDFLEEVCFLGVVALGLV